MTFFDGSRSYAEEKKAMSCWERLPRSLRCPPSPVLVPLPTRRAFNRAATSSASCFSDRVVGGGGAVEQVGEAEAVAGDDCEAPIVCSSG